jgi:hypothetical protein
MAAIDKFEVLIKNFINFPELYEQQKGTNEACKAPRMSQNRAPSAERCWCSLEEFMRNLSVIYLRARPKCEHRTSGKSQIPRLG